MALGDWLFPVVGNNVRISSGFGHRSSPGGIGSTTHRGIDFAAPRGTGIVAPVSGRVVSAGWNNGGFGNLVTLQGDDGLRYNFAHMDAIGVRPGMQVGAGAALGTVGSTGRSTGPHLHLGVQDARGNYVDPSRLVRGARRSTTDISNVSMIGTIGNAIGHAFGVENGDDILSTAVSAAMMTNPATAPFAGMMGSGEGGWIEWLLEKLNLTGFFLRSGLVIIGFLLILGAFIIWKRKEITSIASSVIPVGRIAGAAKGALSKAATSAT